jgi:hypothetical protein
MRYVAQMSLRIACLVLTVIGAAPARADDLSDFHAAVETAMAARRAVTAYIVEGNRQRALIELEGMREAWGKVATVRRPVAFDQQRYTETMLDISTRMVAMALVMNLGRPDVALESLEAVRISLSKLRRESGVTVLADCVADADTDFTALSEAAEKPNFENGSLPALSDAYRSTLARCDRTAPPSARDRGEFRKPVDGALAILAQLPQAIQAGDAALLNGLLKALGGFNDALARQYG